MRNFAFVLWMIGFPLATSVGRYLSFLQGENDSLTVEPYTAFAALLIWIFVGILLYEKNK